MAPREFELPDVGEGVAEGEIISWLVEEGESVSEAQPIVEVETDKALVEIPAPLDAVVETLHGDPGDIVPVGSVIVSFEAAEDPDEGQDAVEGSASGDGAGGSDSAETATSRNARTDLPVVAAPSVRRLARELDVELASVDPADATRRVSERDVRAMANGNPPEAEPALEATESEGRAAKALTAPAETARIESPEQAAGESRDPSPASDQFRTGSANRDRTLAVPATRQLATDLGVDLDTVPATEQREGEAFVTEAAVRAFADESENRAANQCADAPDRIPYQGVRRTIGEAMEQSAFTAPHVTHHDVVEVSGLVDARKALADDAAERGVSLSYLPFAIQAVSAALEAHPTLNSTFEDGAEEILVHDRFDVGIAVATDAGLMVPVLRDADSKSILELASESAALAERARERTVSREELQNGTFTITNFGAIGGEYATPIINRPEVAILGLGAIRERPWVENGDVVARHTLPLSLSIDHRVIDGAVAAGFVNELKSYLSEPWRLLLE